MSKLTDKLTAERLRSVLDYSPDTGIFIWKYRPESEFGSYRAFRIWNGQHQGKVAGSPASGGYLRIKIDQVGYLSHRLAWLHTHGNWPENSVDHINGVRADNKIKNLRDASPSENSQNQRKAPASNKSTGVLGVTNYGGRFVARIRINGKKTNLGTFDTVDSAHHAYVMAKRQHHAGGTL